MKNAQPDGLISSYGISIISVVSDVWDDTSVQLERAAFQRGPVRSFDGFCMSRFGSSGI